MDIQLSIKKDTYLYIYVSIYKKNNKTENGAAAWNKIKISSD